MFSIPAKLYHGTTKEAADQIMRNGLIDPRKWRPATDFGPAFYATTDFRKAFLWQRKVQKRLFAGMGAVLTLRVDPNALSKASVECFQGPSTEWARYVLYHRLELCGDLCGDRHADIVVGPIADNAIATWIKRFKERPYKSIESSVEEFRAFITSAQDGRRLTEAQLGTQIAFCNPEQAGAILQVAKIEYFGPAEG